MPTPSATAQPPSRCLVGIDPGASGALCFLDPDAPTPAGALLSVHDLPYYRLRTASGKKGRSRSVLDRTALQSLFAQAPAPIAHVFIEEQIASPGQSPVGLATTFRNLGALETLVALLNVPFSLPLPSEWKASVLRGLPKGNKEASVNRVLQLFPHAPVRGPRGGLLHDRAEAILIALYGKKALARLGF